MTIYKCLLCNFSSKLKGDFRRHLNTTKHKKSLIIDEGKTQKDPQMTQKDPQMTQKDPQMTQKDPVKKKHNCDHCDKYFTTIAHKRRHELHRCKKSSYTKEKWKNELKIL